MSSLASLPNLFFKNRRSLGGASSAGCVKCLRVIEAKEIVSFTDRDETCLCPNCGHDTLLLDSQVPISEEFLRKANRYLFGRN